MHEVGGRTGNGSSRYGTIGLFGRVAASLLSILAVSFLVSQPVSGQAKSDLTLTLVPSVYSVEAKAGKDFRLALEVRNIGTETLTGIGLSSDRPSGWTVSIDPSEIDTLAPGAVSRSSIAIRPGSTVAKGDYQVTFTASADGIQRMQFLQIRVKPASYWLWVVFGIAAVVVAVFVMVFLRAGRRR
jgi:uncharacterized membrane protein